MTDLSAIYPCTLLTMSVYTERSKLLQYDITLSHGGTKPASHRHKIKFRDSAKPRTFGPYRELIIFSYFYYLRYFLREFISLSVDRPGLGFTN